MGLVFFFGKTFRMTESKLKCIFFKGVCIIPVDNPDKSKCATVYEEVDISKEKGKIKLCYIRFTQKNFKLK